jgi:hypothetical protein
MPVIISNELAADSRPVQWKCQQGSGHDVARKINAAFSASSPRWTGRSGRCRPDHRGKLLCSWFAPPVLDSLLLYEVAVGVQGAPEPAFVTGLQDCGRVCGVEVAVHQVAPWWMLDLEGPRFRVLDDVTLRRVHASRCTGRPPGGTRSLCVVDEAAAAPCGLSRLTHQQAPPIPPRRGPLMRADGLGPGRCCAPVGTLEDDMWRFDTPARKVLL